MNGVLIIGGGQGGARAAIELRHAGYQGPIAILTDEEHAPYERPPLSKDVLLRGVDAAGAHVVPLAELQKANIALHLNDRVVRIDPQGKQVYTASGKECAYDELIVATGARARRVPIPGSELEGVLTLRDAGDALRLRETLASAKGIAVIGGGVLGLEIAASARVLGIEVTVLESAKNCLERMLPPAAVVPVIDLHREKGARIRCGVQIDRIIGGVTVAGVLLRDGETIACDFVIMATGSVANDTLLSEAGAECAGGVLVDEQCRTSLPNVFAIGDVAVDRATRMRQESWDNANRQAAVVASVIADHPVPADTPAWFWSDQYDLNLQVLGMPRAGDVSVVRAGNGTRQHIQFYLRDGIVSGAVLFDSGRDRRAVAQLIGRHMDAGLLSDTQVSLKQLVSQ